MGHKVLLADDSLTIQKVIKITLASEPFDIQECHSTEELMGKLSDKPELVFLDFGLDDNLDGYELARQIKEKLPEVKILMLYGTFDTVDYDSLNDSGVDANIIKPFDSNKFISICNELVEVKSEPAPHTRNELPGGPVVKDVEPPVLEEEDDDLDEWNQENTAPLEEEIEEDQGSSSLEAAAAEWGGSSEDIEEEIEDEEGELPPVMGDEGDDSQDDLKHLDNLPKEPPADRFKNDALEVTRSDSIIQHYDLDKDELVDPDGKSFPKAKKESHLSMVENVAEDAFDDEEDMDLETSSVDDTSLPNEDDLEYPDMDSLSADEYELPNDDDLEYPSMETASEEKEDKRKPQLVSLEELAPEPPPIEMEDISFDPGVGTNSEEELQNISMQIEDEIDDDDLWSIDEGISPPPVMSRTAPTPSELEDDDMDEEIDEDAKMLTKETLDSATPGISPMAFDATQLSREIQSDLESKIASLVQEIVEEKVRKYCEQQVDRVIWDVIPELAENVIKKELAKISQSVMDDH